MSFESPRGQCVNSLRLHICIGNLTTIGSDNGLSPSRCQAIILTNAGILLIGPFRTNFSEILIEIHTFSFKKMHLKMSSGKWWPFCLGLNMVTSMVQFQLIAFNDFTTIYYIQFQLIAFSDFTTIYHIFDWPGREFMISTSTLLSVQHEADPGSNHCRSAFSGSYGV